MGTCKILEEREREGEEKPHPQKVYIWRETRY